MKLTKQQIRDMNIREYYILIDGCNDDHLCRATDIRDIEECAREYDDECDGEWDPICVIYNRDTKKCEFFDDWSY